MTVAIYALIDPRDDTIRYVGRSARPATRLSQHLRTGSRAVRGWVSELRTLGLAPRQEILEYVSTENAHSSEAKWIARHQVENLLNVNSEKNYRLCEPQRQRVELMLSRRELALLDRQRGAAPRASYIRSLIRNAETAPPALVVNGYAVVQCPKCDGVIYPP